MQDEPVMGVKEVFCRYPSLQNILDIVNGLSRRKAEPVAKAEDVRIDRDRRLAESHGDDNVGCFAPNARSHGVWVFCARRALPAYHP